MRSVRVLVVEDEPGLLDAIGKTLREEGYAVDSLRGMRSTTGCAASTEARMTTW